MEAEPVQFLWRRYEERLEFSRLVVARFLRVNPKNLVFVSNATTGVNAVMRSLQLRRGDQVLTTDLDYNACRNALSEGTRSVGAKLVVAPISLPVKSSDEIVEAVLSHVTPRTRLAMIDHVTSNSGMVLPVERLVRELAKRGVDTLVDGAHGPGMLPLNIEKLAPAYYTGNLHKWVCAPKGAAFLWARPDKQERLQPAIISHGNNTPRPGFSPFQDRFDWAGTMDPTAWMCAGAAINWMADLLPGGWTELRMRNRQLALEGRRLLCEQLQVQPICPESMIGFMATLPLPERFQGKVRTGKIDEEQLRLYDEFGIEVPFVRTPGSGLRCFRISAHIYNTLQEYEYLAAAIQCL